MPMSLEKYHDLSSKARDTDCYVWNIERYDPYGNARSLSIMCTNLGFDDKSDEKYIAMLVETFLKELRDAKSTIEVRST